MFGVTKLKQTLIESFNKIPAGTQERIVSLFHRAARPMFLGQISLEIGWSLERTELMLNELVGLGVLRRALPEEMRKIGAVTDDANVYTLVDAPSAALARW